MHNNGNGARIDRTRGNRNRHFPIAPPPETYKLDMTMKLLTRGNIGYSFYDYGIAADAATFRRHEDEGKHPTLHEARSCSAYKSLVTRAKRLRDQLIKMNLDEVEFDG